jgi:hypothetical protein
MIGRESTSQARGDRSMKPKLRDIASQPSWVVASDKVQLTVTQLGGHMAPVTFFRDTSRPVRPYYVSGWQGEGRKIDDPVLRPLRGDFFCLPFGAPSTYRGTSHVCHGEPATKRWRCRGVAKDGRVTRLTLTMATKVLPGKVTKHLSLVDGQNVIYVQHVLEGYACRTSLGHHATLAVPEKARSLRVATSPFALGMNCPGVVGDPAEAQYQSLAPGERFTSLRRVPLLWKKPAFGDCTAFPVREGFTDLLGVFPKAGRDPAWTTATHDDAGTLWFSLKDAAVLPATLFWISNRGRHNAPWNGRNRCLGLEDVCGYFANGLSRRGIPTAIKLSPKRPTSINYIEGMARVPRGFQCVRSAEFAPGKVTFTSVTGKKVAVRVRHEFLGTGVL